MHLRVALTGGIASGKSFVAGVLTDLGAVVIDADVLAMQTLTAALEHLAALDARAERPLRSALVISQGASRLPRTGFFDCVTRLGRFSGASDGVAAASWHAAEVVRVFEFEYPADV